MIAAACEPISISDPVFTQIKLVQDQRNFRALVDAHDVHFSFGECLPGSLPQTGHKWIPTRQPIVLDQWRAQEPVRRLFTTVMNWASYKVEEMSGRTYGQKHIELARFLDLPARVAPAQLEIAGRGIFRSSLPDESDRSFQEAPRTPALQRMAHRRRS